jgi:N-acetylmuramoyl-L-alanine amidase
MAVLHYTGMRSGAEAIARLCDPQAKVSAHYVVEEDGRVFALVPEERRAWHAGASFWKGERDINAVSVGIEIVNPGHEFGYRPFPDDQVEAVIGLLDGIRGRWEISDGRILGHSDVAPARKEDPGELFPWRRLAEAGHGLWVEPDPAPGAPLAVGDKGPGVFALQAGLTRLGYDSAPSGQYDGDTEIIVRAFQRHWRPSQVDGVADGETRARLVHLLRAAADGG